MGGRGASSGAGTSREAIYSDGRKGVREFTDKFKSAMKRAGFTDSYIFSVTDHDTVQDAIKDVMKDARDEVEYEKNRGGSGKGFQSLYDRLDKESKAIRSSEQRNSRAIQFSKGGNEGSISRINTTTGQKYLAVTATSSKEFKTEKGALNYMEKLRI